MITLERYPKIGKVPDYNGVEFGKIQISSAELAKYVGHKIHVVIKIEEPHDMEMSDEAAFYTQKYRNAGAYNDD